MELVLDLTRHCLRTELSRQYNSLVSSFFRGQVQDLDKGTFALKLLKWLLQGVDLAALRGRYPELAGGDRSFFSRICPGD